ncbi:hypothetical protein JWG40_12755 [Leptospira sp. 201903074]|uniref:LIC_12337 family protein n=1 Tax=Leptospira abararensis TaxID=2810036 RepID=UPI0019641E9A|nr:hypothetical protein [Leptospira abararensis]MBM9547894.1 hypothetical protein [Leptospira abararensis]
MKKILYTFIFLGMSFHISDFNQQKGLAQEIQLSKLFSNALQLGIGSEKLWSATSADNWGFVRQSATWARGNSGIIDSLILALKNAGYFNNSAPRNDVLNNINLSGFGSATLTIKISQTISGIASTAYAGTKTFNHFFEIKKTGASAPSLQLFFDDPDTTLGNDGALIYYRLVDFGNPQFATVGDVITESYTGNESIYGTKLQTYTWRNGPENAAWISKVGRVILTEVDSGRQLCFRSTVKLNFSKLEALNPSVVTLKNACTTTQGAGDSVYYVLAYMQKFDSPFLTTAKATITKTAAKPETICAIPETPSTPGVRLSYGIFDINGYVTDQLLAAQVPIGYPSPTQGGADFMSVDDAFARTYVPAGALSGQVNVQTYEASDKTFLDSIDSAAGNLVFKTVP